MNVNIKKLNFRQKIVLKKCNIEGKGLEIGPSFNPIVPKKMGFDVEILDHEDKAGLLEKYSTQVHLDKKIEEIIEEVDYVWKGQSYLELIGEAKKYDYIISSHLIEHVPDLIQHLNYCSQILKDDGIYSLIIPDKRYTFDFFRQITTVKDCINAHKNQSSNHSSGSCVDYFLNCVSNNKKIAWGKFDQIDKFSMIHGIADAQNLMNSKEYLDIHESVFVPASFELLITDLNMLGFIDFYIDSINISRFHGEFYAVLKKGKIEKFSKEDRIKLLQKIMIQVADPFKMSTKIKRDIMFMAKQCVKFPYMGYMKIRKYFVLFKNK